jgi:hypothetical protein
MPSWFVKLLELLNIKIWLPSKSHHKHLFLKKILQHEKESMPLKK